MSRVPLCVSRMRTLSSGFGCTQTIQDDLTSRPWHICKAAISKPGHVHGFGQQPPGRRSEPWGRGQHLARGCPRGRVGRLRGPPPSGPLCFLKEPLRPVTWTGLWVALGPHPGSSHSSSARLALWAAWWEPGRAPTGAALTQWGCGARTRTAPRSGPALSLPVTL